MPSRTRQLEKRLVLIEEALSSRLRQGCEPGTLSPIQQVEIEAIKDLSRGEAALFHRAKAARRKIRCQTPEEQAVVKMHCDALAIAAQRLGFPSLGAAAHRTFVVCGKVPISRTAANLIVNILDWARRNDAHIHQVRAQMQGEAAGVPVDRRPDDIAA